MAQAPMLTAGHSLKASVLEILAGFHTLRCATTDPVLEPDNHAWTRPRVASTVKGAKVKAVVDQAAKAAKDLRATHRKARCPEMGEKPALPGVELSTAVVAGAEKGTTQEEDQGEEAHTQ